MPDEPDLHADAEHWPDNRDDDACEACGGPRVVYIPVWADGSGALTPEEIGEVLGRARLRVLEEWERTESHGLEPMITEMPDDIVMRIDGRRDGSFRAVLLATGGVEGQTYRRHGKGSRYVGVFGWRHGLAVSGYCHPDTRPEEQAEGLIAYEGAPGILNFTRRVPYDGRTEEAQEEFRMERALRDRTSRTTSWSRHIKREPESSGEDPGSGVTPTNAPAR